MEVSRVIGDPGSANIRIMIQKNRLSSGTASFHIVADVPLFRCSLSD